MNLKDFAKEWGDTARLISGILATVIAGKALVVPYLLGDRGPAITIHAVSLAPTSDVSEGVIRIWATKLRPCHMAGTVLNVSDILGGEWVLPNTISTLTLRTNVRVSATFRATFPEGFSLVNFKAGVLEITYRDCTDGAAPKVPVVSPVSVERVDEE